MGDEDKLNSKIIRIYNNVRDLIWVGDFEGIKETLREITEITDLYEFLKEEEKWKRICGKIRQELRGVPEKEREEKRNLMVKQKSMEVNVNKVIMATLLGELDKLRKSTLTPSLTFFSDPVQKPVKEKTYTYLLLKKTEREFEVRALIKGLPEKEVIEKLKKVGEEQGYAASEPHISNYSFSVELYSSKAYIEIRCLYPRVLILLSFYQPPTPDKVKDHVEVILKTITQR